MTTLLETLVHDQATHTVSASVRIAIEQIAGEIAKEALADEEFRRALRALVQQTAHQIFADLARPQP